jgi:hypothetical protein
MKNKIEVLIKIPNIADLDIARVKPTKKRNRRIP